MNPVASLERDKIWGPNRAALKREKSRPKIVNEAIEAAGRRGSRFVVLPMQHESDAKEMAEYINSNSSYKAQVEPAPEAPRPNRPVDDPSASAAVDYAMEHLKTLVWAVDVERTGKYFCVSFWLPEITPAELVAYDLKCKAHQREREAQIQKLQLQNRNISYAVGGVDPFGLPLPGTVLDPTNE